MAIQLDGRAFQGQDPDQAPNPGDIFVPVNLGQLQVDDVGHLLFIPADGSVPQSQRGGRIDPEGLYALDTARWVDNVCDGWVKVEVTHQLNLQFEIVRDW